MGVVVVGPSGSGKTILWKLLRTALGKLGQVVKQYTMNPKAMPRTQVCVLDFAWIIQNNGKIIGNAIIGCVPTACSILLSRVWNKLLSCCDN